MQLNIQTTRKIHTLEVPFVVSSPPLVFGFDARPSFATVQKVIRWAQSEGEIDSLTNICYELIKWVEVDEPNEERQVVNNETDIEEMIEQVGKDFIALVISHWLGILAVERNEYKKKQAV